MKKPFTKKQKIISIIVGVIIVLAICIGVPTSSNSEVIETTTLPQIEETSTIEETTQETFVDEQASIERLKKNLQDNFGNQHKIIVDENKKIITINIWRDGIAQGVVLAKTGNQECLQSWITMRQSLIDLSKGVQPTVPSYSLVITVLNDSNKDNVLLGLRNGIVLYDALA